MIYEMNQVMVMQTGMIVMFILSTIQTVGCTLNNIRLKKEIESLKDKEKIS